MLHLPTKQYAASASRMELHWGVAGSLLTFCLAALLQRRVSDMLFDDAFIHLRVARNLEVHGAAVFNIGERVMTTSSPLWTVVLALLGIGTHRWILPYFEAGLLTTCGVLAYLLSRKLLPDSTEKTKPAPEAVHRATLKSVLLAGIAGILTMLIVLPSSIGQMETPLAAALLLGATVSFAHGSSLGLPLLALGACTRLELLPLLLVAGVTAARNRVSRPSAAVAAGLVLSMLTAVYAQLGVVLPNSMRAKAIGYAYHRTDIIHQLFEARFLEVPLSCCLALFCGAVFADQLLARGRCKQTLSMSMGIPLRSGLWGVLAMSEYVVRGTPIFEWYRPVFLLPVLICLLMYRTTAVSPWWLPPFLEVTRFAGISLLLKSVIHC